jgi:methyl-accepting chemotaxis protein
MTQQNAAMVEETAAASAKLTEDSRELDHAVGRFQLARAARHGAEGARAAA